MIRILLFSSQATEIAERLGALLQTVVSEKNIEKYYDINMLIQRLRHPGEREDCEVMILLGKDREELTAFAELRGTILWDHKLILLLPDRSKDIAALGHRLRPRYIGVIDENLEDVIQVVTKMRDVSIKYNALQ